MTSLGVLAPVLLSVICLLVANLGRGRHPEMRARVATFLLVAAGIASAAWTVVLGGSVIVRSSGIDPQSSVIAGWFTEHGPVPPLVSILACLNLLHAFMVLRASMPFRYRHHAAASRDLMVSSEPGVVAYAVPGRSPFVVVSAAMLRSLRADEIDVVLAHERSHLSHHHHRYLTAGRLSIAFAPWLRPALRCLRFDLERWADEDAAHEIGDRRLVARTIARVAVADLPAGIALGFNSNHMVRRVEAMLDEAPRQPSRLDAIAAASAGAAATGVASSALQLHHAMSLLHRVELVFASL